MPPENQQQYGSLMEARTFPKGTQVFSSPARGFFSLRHFKWLKDNVRSSEKAMVLLAKSPYRDLASGMTSLLTMLCSDKTLTLLGVEQGDFSIKPDLVIDQKNQGLSGDLLSNELNIKFLAQELSRVAWSSYPEFVRNLINYIETELRTYVNTYLNRPVNYRRFDYSTEALQKDVEKSLLLSTSYLNLLVDGVESIQGKKVLEIGPGINLGLTLTLACHGAEVMVADRFLAPWDPDYHPQFYALLKDRLISQWPSLNLAPLDKVLSLGGYPPESISLYPCSLEEIKEVPDQSIDVVISNAVLEHLNSLKSAFFNLSRITKSGGMGIHTVDFRDHRDFDRPLEYLLLSDKEFSRGFKECHGEFGNRYRPQEMRDLLEQVGFEIKNLHPISFVEEEYLAEFLERLRQTQKSRYRDYPVEDLCLMIGTFIMIKK